MQKLNASNLHRVQISESVAALICDLAFIAPSLIRETFMKPCNYFYCIIFVQWIFQRLTFLSTSFHWIGCPRWSSISWRLLLLVITIFVIVILIMMINVDYLRNHRKGERLTWRLERESQSYHVQPWKYSNIENVQPWK